MLPYHWRNLTEEKRKEVLATRRQDRRAWHGPPHRFVEGHTHYHLTAACYEHTPHIGFNPQRMDAFSDTLLELLSAHCEQISAWCVLPNHYHALIQTSDPERLLLNLGRFHGRTSRLWNQEEHCEGRQNFHRAAERNIRSDRHYWATMNYVHHNPVHHGYVEKWSEWPWGSALDFLNQTGRQEVERLWHSYPLLEYGEGWDDPCL